MECRRVVINRKGELRYTCKEPLLSGDIRSTTEKLIRDPLITISIVISCAKYLPLLLNHMLTRTRAVQKVCITKLISAKLNPISKKGKKAKAPNCTKIVKKMVRTAIFPFERLSKFSCFILFLETKITEERVNRTFDATRA